MNVMSSESFLDTNLLLYAFSQNTDDKQKKEVCQKLIWSKGAVISTQVLEEFISNALRKPKLGMGEEQIDLILQVAKELRVVSITRELIFEAVLLRRRYQLSHWDSTILAAALEAKCSVLYSEDFRDGQTIGGVEVVNPFA